jgi:ribosomal protein S12 methylthiotransferase accessory factor
MRSVSPVHLFAGPSLFGTPFDDAEPDTRAGALVWHPPARRGDITALLKAQDTPGIIALVDGTFHSYPSVAHVELRDALQAGWRVYGLCSMGAIRVSEMMHLGMQPFGVVAKMFCDDPDFADDEVALVHATEAPFFPFSEPMVHIRAYLADMLARGLLDAQQHAAVVSAMRERWYADRTFARLRDALTEITAPHVHAGLFAHLDDFSPYRLKQRDLMQFLEAQPWLEADANAAPTPLFDPGTLSLGNVPPANAPFLPAFALSSSLRVRTAEESLELVRPLALERGVSRVVDTTWLDRLGLPVYASIRPNAAPGSLNVHAGKGFTHAEAKIGAYMEAIEFSYAEIGRSRVVQQLASPLAVVESFDHQVQFVDFCPSLNQSRPVQANDALGVVVAEELMSLKRNVLVPAELVFTPYYASDGMLQYGASTNGLASGNTVEEATVHGLAEVMERHVESFAKLEAPSYWVDPRTLPARLRAMAECFERAGLELHLRYTPNEFGMAYFSAYVSEEGDYPAAMCAGMGFHCNSSIAAVRAVAEAAQSRLTTIHGGRDDLIMTHLLFNKIGKEKELEVKAALRKAVADKTGGISFADVPDYPAESVMGAYDTLTGALRRAGMNHLARVIFTEENRPFQVVRVIVPGAESYNHHHRRVGPRLLQFSKQQAARQR